jgi:predicted GNAT family N-acyltransferase
MTKTDVLITTGDWASMGDQARHIRFAVFVREQKIDPALELDDFDAVSQHCLAIVSGQPAGTGRLLPDGHIGRMAVLEPYRRHGLGGLILERLVGEAFARGHERVVLSAQAYVERFYARHGFVREGGVYLEAGIEHVSMWRARP